MLLGESTSVHAHVDRDGVSEWVFDRWFKEVRTRPSWQAVSAAAAAAPSAEEIMTQRRSKQ
jgi:hypothetical protein